MKSKRVGFYNVIGLALGVTVTLGLVLWMLFGDPTLPTNAQIGISSCDEDEIAEVKSVTPLSIPVGEQNIVAVYVRIDVCGANDTDWMIAIHNGQLVMAGG